MKTAFVLLIVCFLFGCEGKRQNEYHEHHHYTVINQGGTVQMVNQYKKEVDVKVENATLDTTRTPQVDGQFEVPLVGTP